MRLTKHILQRCQQRGYHLSAIDLILQHGSSTPEGTMLTETDVLHMENELKRQLQHARRLVGTQVVHKDGSLRTIYRPTKHQRRKHRESL